MTYALVLQTGQRAGPIRLTDLEDELYHEMDEALNTWAVLGIMKTDGDTIEWTRPG